MGAAFRRVESPRRKSLTPFPAVVESAHDQFAPRRSPLLLPTYAGGVSWALLAEQFPLAKRLWRSTRFAKAGLIVLSFFEMKRGERKPRGEFQCGEMKGPEGRITKS
jgi:hypothetical protein